MTFNDDFVPSTLVKIRGIQKRRTDKAVLIEIHGSLQEIWFPLSVLPKIVHDPKTHEIEVYCDHWFAKQKDLV